MTSEWLLYKALDIFFLVFHSLLIVFNLFGWIWKKTRFWNFITLNMTAFSWFVLGIWYGWGYCLCTDWHWQVRTILGMPIQQNSYISFLLETLTPIKLSQHKVDLITLLLFLLAYVISFVLQIKRLNFKRKQAKEL